MKNVQLMETKKNESNFADEKFYFDKHDNVSLLHPNDGKDTCSLFDRDDESCIGVHYRRNSYVSISRLNNLEGVKELLAYRKQTVYSMDYRGSTTSVNSISKRFVRKDGFVDIKYANIPGLNSRYMNDIFHTLMDLKWRYICLMFTLSFLISWVVFGTAWYMIFYLRDNPICIDNVDSWVSAFLFSIETQTTIGYGGRAVTSHCPEGILLLVIQTIVGMFINCAMLGLLFAKLARAKNRGKTTTFSTHAVITVRDGNLCLIFRYVDLRHRRLLDTNMRAVIIRPKLTVEGEFIPIDMADLKLTIDFQQEDYTMRLFPLFPVTVIHVINKDSPLYSMSKCQLEQAEIEIIPIIEGTVPTTGNTTQALTSYHPVDILWGHRFKPVFAGFQVGQSINRIDLSTLNDTYKDLHTPYCSAEVFDETRYADDSHSYTVSHSGQNEPDFTIAHNCREGRKLLCREGRNVSMNLLDVTLPQRRASLNPLDFKLPQIIEPKA